MTMYQRIKALREQQGMTQQQLAEKIGFKTASAINKIELGLRDINQTKIVKIAEALNVSPAYLMSGAEDDNSAKARLKNLVDAMTEQEAAAWLSLLEARLNNH